MWLTRLVGHRRFHTSVDHKRYKLRRRPPPEAITILNEKEVVMKVGKLPNPLP